MSTKTDTDGDTDTGESASDALDALDVEGHPDYSRAERETTVCMPGDSDRFTISSFRPSIVRRLLRHPEFQVTHITTYDDDSDTTQARDDLDDVGDATVCGATGTLPVGALFIKPEPRKSTQQAKVVGNRGI